jgi:DNA polymerase-3 subunit delta
MATQNNADAAREFFKELKRAKDPAPLYLLVGEESYLLDQALKEVIKLALPRGPNDFNQDMFYGKEVMGDRVVSACETLAFMGGKRLVLIKEIQHVPTAQLDPLTAYLQKPSPSTVLVCHGLTDKKPLAKTSAFWKQCKKVGVVQEFPALRDWEVGSFLKTRAAARGLRLSDDVEEALVRAVGTDLSTLDSTLERLDLYMGAPHKPDEPRPVTEEVLQAIVAVTRTHEIWDLTDALAKRDLARSMGLLKGMMDQGQSGVGLNAMVARHFRQLWQVKLAARKGLGKNEIASTVGMNPFFVDRYRQAGEKFTDAALREVMRVLLDTDRALKSSRLEDQLLLERAFLAILL